MADDSQWLFDRIVAFGDRPCLICGTGEEATYSDLAACSEKAVTLLTGAIPPGVIFIEPDYSLHSIAMLLAAVRCGRVVAPLTRAAPAEVDKKARIAAASAVITAEPGRWDFRAFEHPTAPHPMIADLHERQRPGLILFSSGSTGEPKAMVHDFHRFLSQYESRRAREMTVLLFLLFDHIGGLNTLFGSLASGMTLVAPQARDADTIASLISRYRIKLLPATPTFLNLMLMGGVPGRYDLRSLRMITYGAEAMPPSLLKRVQAAFPRVKLLQTFGTSETGIARTSSPDSASTILKLDDPGQQYRLVEGELWLRSKTQVLGYLNASNDRFTEDGWFRTGDLAEALPDGTLRILGRGGALINVGGEKVYPTEVESCLLELPEVAACKVYASPNAITGQAVTAEIVPAADIDGPTLRGKVRAHARARLARHKVPVKIVITSELAVTERFKSATPARG